MIYGGEAMARLSRIRFSNAMESASAAAAGAADVPPAVHSAW